MPHDRPWLTTEGAAVRANCSRTSILRAIDRKELRATKLNHGRIYRVHESWVDAWLGLNALPEKETSAGS